MLYLVVNDRTLPHLHNFPRRCSFCCEPIVEGYVRELATRLPYCSAEHLRAHCLRTEQYLLEHSA